MTGSPTRSSLPGTTQVLLIEDHHVLAASLQAALGAEGFRAAIAPLSSRHAVVSRAGAVGASVALLDLELGPPIGDGLTLIPPLSAAGVGVVVVSASTSRFRLAACVDAGARGFVPKTSTLDQLVDAVRAVADGRPLLAPDDVSQLRSELLQYRQECAGLDRLTRREATVLRMLADGRSAAEISQAAFVSEGTVRTHIRSILRKLGVRSQLAAVAASRRAGW